MVDDHEEFEVGQRLEGELLIGEGDGGVAAAHDQCPNTTFAGSEDLLGQRGRRHLTAVAAQVPRMRDGGPLAGVRGATTCARWGVSG